MNQNNHPNRLEREVMKAHDISQARNPILRGSVAAMQRAAELARKTAIQTDTGIVVVRDGKIVHVSAQELRNTMTAEISHD
jgi:hypothetical protein